MSDTKNFSCSWCGRYCSTAKCYRYESPPDGPLFAEYEIVSYCDSCAELTSIARRVKDPMSYWSEITKDEYLNELIVGTVMQS